MYCSESCREKHSEDHSLECGWMNLLESFPDAGMLLQAIAKDPSYLEKDAKPDRGQEFPVERGKKYQQSFCDTSQLLNWKDSSKRLGILRQYSLVVVIFEAHHQT